MKTRRAVPALLTLVIAWAAAAPVHALPWSAAIKVNHLGYRPNDPKIAVLTANPGPNVEIRRVSDDALLYTVSGPLLTGPFDDSAGDSGDGTVYLADFSGLATPGTYVVRSATIGGDSYPFEIAADAYDRLATTLLKAMYFERCGTAHPAAYMGTPWADSLACHQDDLACLHNAVDDASGTDYGPLDLSGGWHDAGDYNKYIGAKGPFSGDAGNAVWYLATAYEMNTTAWTDGQTGIPESGNGLPDILDEVKVGLEWYRKMQRPTGAVLSVVHTPTSGNPPVPLTTPPSADTGSRYYSSATPESTALAGAALALGARVLKNRDAAASASYQAAAEAAWGWLDGNVSSTALFESRLWFAAELFRLDPATVSGTEAQAYVDAYVPGWTAWDAAASWSNWAPGTIVGTLGWRAFVAYTLAPGATASTVNGMRAQFDTLVDGVNGSFAIAGPYGSGMRSGEYAWSSNETKALRGLLLLHAARIGATGTKTAAQTRDQALWYLHYLCGVNALNMLYATNLAGIGGEHSVWRIYHTWFPYGNTSYYGKPPATAEPAYPYYAGTDSQMIDDNKNSAYGPFPGIATDGPNFNYPEAGCSGNGVTPPLGGLDGINAPHRVYRDWNWCCTGGDATGTVACPWQVNETGIYYIASFAALAGSFVTGGAKLSASLDPLPAAIQPGDWVTATLRLTNGGGADATGVTATLSVDAGATPAAFRAGPPAAPVTIGPGATLAFSWTYSVNGTGWIGFTGTGTGTDAVSAGTLTASASRSTTVTLPSVLAGALTVSPATAVVGGTVTATFVVTNLGQTAAGGVTPFVASAGTGSLRLLLGPVPSATALLAPGATASFAWTFAVDAPGTVVLTASAAGTDVAGFQRVEGSAARAFAANTAASLACAAAVSSTRVALGQTVTLTYTVSNTGGLSADGVAPTVSAAGDGTLLTVGGPSPAPPVSVAGGASVSFVWTFSATARGRVTLTCAAAGTGAITGSDASCGASPAPPVEIVLVVTTVPPGQAKVFGGARGWLEPASGVPGRLIVHPTGAGPVTAKIYDLKGRLIRELTTTAPGDEEVSLDWDGTDAKGDRVPPGVYPFLVTGPGVKVRDKIAVGR